MTSNTYTPEPNDPFAPESKRTLLPQMLLFTVPMLVVVAMLVMGILTAPADIPIELLVAMYAGIALVVLAPVYLFTMTPCRETGKPLRVELRDLEKRLASLKEKVAGTPSFKTSYADGWLVVDMAVGEETSTGPSYRERASRRTQSPDDVKRAQLEMKVAMLERLIAVQSSDPENWRSDLSADVTENLEVGMTKRVFTTINAPFFVAIRDGKMIAGFHGENPDIPIPNHIDADFKLEDDQLKANPAVIRTDSASKGRIRDITMNVRPVTLRPTSPTGPWYERWQEKSAGLAACMDALLNGGITIGSLPWPTVIPISSAVKLTTSGSVHVPSDLPSVVFTPDVRSSHLAKPSPIEIGIPKASEVTVHLNVPELPGVFPDVILRGTATFLVEYLTNLGTWVSSGDETPPKPTYDVCRRSLYVSQPASKAISKPNQ